MNRSKPSRARDSVLAACVALSGIAMLVGLSGRSESVSLMSMVDQAGRMTHSQGRHVTVRFRQSVDGSQVTSGALASMDDDWIVLQIMPAHNGLSMFVNGKLEHKPGQPGRVTAIPRDNVAEILFSIPLQQESKDGHH